MFFGIMGRNALCIKEIDDLQENSGYFINNLILYNLSIGVHLNNNVTTTDEFAIHINLRNCRPITKFFDTLPQ
jgi:hypothetical protein